MRKALINYVNLCAKCDFFSVSVSQALCVCVAAAAGAFFSWKNTSLDCWTMYFVDCLSFFVDFRSELEHANCERL